MKKDITLVILAAGMGSRFGGLKQIEPMGPNGEFIIDYSVYDAITAAYDGTFPGGATTTFNVTNDGVGIAMDTAKFENFTQEDYDAIYAKLVAGEIVIDNDTDKDVTELSFDHVTVNSVQ